MKHLPVLAALVLAIAAQGQSPATPSHHPVSRTVQLPSSKLLFQPTPGDPVPTNSFPGTMALSPDHRYAALLNNGRGTSESQFDQSIGIYDFETSKLTDFPDPRFRLDARQTFYYGMAFSSDGRELFVSVASLTDPQGKEPGNLGNGIAVYAFRDGALTPSRFLRLPLQKVPDGHHKTEVCKSCATGEVPAYPAGIGILRGDQGAPDRLVIADDLADNVVVMDAVTGAIQQTFDLSIHADIPAAFPFQVAIAPDQRHAYVSLWNTDTVADLDLAAGKVARVISMEEEHPGPSTSSAHATEMAIAGDHLFVALTNRDQVIVVNRESGAVEGRISTRLPGQKFGGAYPTSIALGVEGKELFVANAGTDSVNVYDIAWRKTSADSGRSVFSKSTLRGAIPTEWYPVAVRLRGDDLLIATAKGPGTGPNNQHPHKGDARKHFRYIGGMVYGSLAHLKLSGIQGDYPAFTAEVEKSNRLVGKPPAKIAFHGLAPKASPIQHVIYIIKENRTYDQVLGDLGSGNGDPSLTLYGWEVTPNHHKLALQFGVLDNFYASGEISGNGHVWSTAAITSDYTEKNWPVDYRGNEHTYDYEGAVGNELPLEQGIPDIDEPGTGFLWANAKRSGVSYRHYGEFVESVWCVPAGDWELSPAYASIRQEQCAKKTISRGDPLPPNVGNPRGGPSPYPWEIPVLVKDRATKPELVGHFDPLFADFRTEYPDQLRTDEFLREFGDFVAARERHDAAHGLPQLIVLRLPNDHTGGTRAGFPTPAAAVADNDLALGRIVEAVSRSPYWDSTAILVLEDDAQDGPDHVDAHRSPALVISKYSPAPVNGKSFVESGFFTTVNMIRTLEDLLRMPPMNHNDALAAPMAAIFDGKGDQPAYPADDRNLKNGLLMKVNPPKAKGSEASALMDFSAPDRADAAQLNRILWEDMKGDQPMPPPRHTVIPEKSGDGQQH